MNPRSLLAVISVITFGLLWNRGMNAGMDSVKGSVVHARDLVSEETMILGLLERPYGTVVKIRGHWSQNPSELKTGKGPKFFFVITEIEDKAVDLPERVRLISDLVVPLDRSSYHEKVVFDGEEFVGRVYEAGGYLRKPLEVSTIVGEPLSADPLSFRFYSILYLID